MSNAAREGRGRRDWLWPLGIGLLALTVRGVNLIDLSDHPAFLHPLLDAAKYDRMAVHLSQTGRLSDGFFRQSCFYPFFLTAVYTLTGAPLLATSGGGDGAAGRGGHRAGRAGDVAHASREMQATSSQSRAATPRQSGPIARPCAWRPTWPAPT